MKKIICRINVKTGVMTTVTEGYNGAECLNDPKVKKFEDGLGLTDAPTEMTSEFYNTTEQTQKLEGQ
jgi:hypothetical protein